MKKEINGDIYEVEMLPTDDFGLFKNGVLVKPFCSRREAEDNLNSLEVTNDISDFSMVIDNAQFPDKSVVGAVRTAYPEGCRVELISMGDDNTNLKPGDRGTVRYVDATATVFISWDSGSALGAVYGIDKIKRI